MVPDALRKSVPQYFEEKQFIEADNIADAVVYALSTPPHVQVKIHEFFLLHDIPC